MSSKLTHKDMEESYVRRGLPRTFCPVPFSTLIFEANGSVCMCRQKGAEFVIGDIRRQSIGEIWNGQVLQEIRKEFLTGQITTCSKEIARDHCNLAVDHGTFLSEVDPSVIQKKPPIRITPNFNGRCNLECPMCHIWQFPNGLYDSIGFWPTLEKEVLPHLVEIDTFSGEPFIQKDTYRLIQLAAKVNPAVRWCFTTNGQWVFNEKIRSHLDLIQIKNINFSIDTLNPETYPLIRKKGSLRKLLDSFQSMQEYQKARLSDRGNTFTLTLICIAQRLNFHDLQGVLSFRREKGILIHLQCLIEPFQLSLLTRDTAEIMSDLDYLFENLTVEDLITCNRVVSSLVGALPAIDRIKYLLQYQKYVILKK